MIEFFLRVGLKMGEIEGGGERGERREHCVFHYGSHINDEFDACLFCLHFIEFDAFQIYLFFVFFLAHQR